MAHSMGAWHTKVAQRETGISPEHGLAITREQYKVGKGKDLVSWKAGAASDTEKIRQFGGFLTISACHETPGKYRLTLPTLAVDLKYIKTESPIIIFVAGPLFELWPPEVWAEKLPIPDVEKFDQEIKGLTD